jgi:hypothetical protein
MASPDEGRRDEVQASIAASLRSMAESLARIAAALSQPQPRPPFRGRRESRFQPMADRGEPPERGYGPPQSRRPGGEGRERFGPRRRWDRGPRPGGEHR